MIGNRGFGYYGRDSCRSLRSRTSLTKSDILPDLPRPNLWFVRGRSLVSNPLGSAISLFPVHLRKTGHPVRHHELRHPDVMNLS